MLAVAVLGFGAVAAAGRFGSMPPVVGDTPQSNIPEGVLDADKLAQVRFSVVARGYDMSQVDALLDRLAEALRAHSAPVVAEPRAGSRFMDRPE